MQKIVYKVVILIVISILFSSCENKTESSKTTFEKYKDTYGIPWEKDLETAFQKAKEEHKLVMVMAVSKNCKWCKKMKKNTLSNKEVAKRLENYILVMADRETQNEREQLPPFKHVPIIFFMTHNRESLDDIRGYFNAKDFLEYLTGFEEE